MQTWKPPKNEKDATDQWYALMKQRVAAEKVLEAAKKEEDHAEDWLLKFYPKYAKAKMEYIIGTHCFLQLVPFPKVKLTDFDEFMKWVRAGRGSRDDLLYRRAKEDTVREYWKKGEPIPGIEEDVVIKPSYRSI